MGGVEAKIRKLFEKVKALLQIKINCTKFVLKYDIYIIKVKEYKQFEIPLGAP